MRRDMPAPVTLRSAPASLPCEPFDVVNARIMTGSGMGGTGGGGMKEDDDPAQSVTSRCGMSNCESGPRARGDEARVSVALRFRRWCKLRFRSLKTDVAGEGFQ